MVPHEFPNALFFLLLPDSPVADSCWAATVAPPGRRPVLDAACLDPRTARPAAAGTPFARSRERYGRATRSRPAASPCGTPWPPPGAGPVR